MFILIPPQRQAALWVKDVSCTRKLCSSLIAKHLHNIEDYILLHLNLMVKAVLVEKGVKSILKKCLAPRDVILDTWQRICLFISLVCRIHSRTLHCINLNEALRGPRLAGADMRCPWQCGQQSLTLLCYFPPLWLLSGDGHWCSLTFPES